MQIVDFLAPIFFMYQVCFPRESEHSRGLSFVKVHLDNRTCMAFNDRKSYGPLKYMVAVYILNFETRKL